MYRAQIILMNLSQNSCVSPTLRTIKIRLLTTMSFPVRFFNLLKVDLFD